MRFMLGWTRFPSFPTQNPALFLLKISPGKSVGGAKADPSEKIRSVSNAADKASNYGKGWKVNPFIVVLPNETFTIADIKGCGAIQ